MLSENNSNININKKIIKKKRSTFKIGFFNGSKIKKRNNFEKIKTKTKTKKKKSEIGIERERERETFNGLSLDKGEKSENIEFSGPIL